VKRLLKWVGRHVSLPASSLHLLTYALTPSRAAIDVDLGVWMREHELDGSTLLGLHTLLIEH